MQEVRGQLGKGILPDVLRHVAFLRETGRLVLLADTRRGLVVIRSGRPVHAACRRPDGSAAQGLEALAMLLGWEGGTYRFDPLEGLNRATDASGSGPTVFTQDDTLAGDVEALLEAAQARRSQNGSAHGVRAAGAVTASAAPAAQPAAWGRTERSPTDESTDPTDPSLHETDETDEDVFLLPPAPAAEIGSPTVLSRREIHTLTDDVAVPRGSLSLWLRLDGATSLADHAEAIGVDVERATLWAKRLVQEGLAEVEPEPVVAPEFVSRLAEELIEIMGPMGEILVEEAVDELDLDPNGLPVARVPELVDALASQLQRSDWQMRLRGRAARLQADMTIPPGVKEPR